MREDFHYYATYCAACLAGYSHEDSLAVAYSAQLVDLCSVSFLDRIGGPRQAATTQLQAELTDASTDLIELQTITRIWASFHFLPYDLYANKKGCSRFYLRKYRLICRPNGELVKETVELAKGRGLQAAGLAMHVLADTWAHQNFAGTPSLVINNTDRRFTELMEDGTERPIEFRHALSAPDDLEKGIYTNTMYQADENSVMNLGHGRAGHLPDYSFMRYKYLPAWADYEECVKDNPSDYYRAFCQMIYALKYLKDGEGAFQLDTYDDAAAAPYEKEIRAILGKRRLDASEDWKTFVEKLSGEAVEPFDLNRWQAQYRAAGGSGQSRDAAGGSRKKGGVSADDGGHGKDATFLGRFILAALAQKSMVTNRIFTSGNLIAGFSVDLKESGFKGLSDFSALIRYFSKEDGQ